MSKLSKLFKIQIVFQVWSGGVKFTAQETFFETGRWPKEARDKARQALTLEVASAELGTIQKVVSSTATPHSVS